MFARRTSLALLNPASARSAISRRFFSSNHIARQEASTQQQSLTVHTELVEKDAVAKLQEFRTKFTENLKNHLTDYAQKETEKYLSYQKDIPLSIAQAKEAMSKLTALLDSPNVTKEFGELAALPNDETNLPEKQRRIKRILHKLRVNVMRDYGYAKYNQDHGPFRFHIGQLSKNNEELQQAVKNFYAVVCKRTHGIDLPATFLLHDARAIAIRYTAIRLAKKDLVFDTDVMHDMTQRLVKEAEEQQQTWPKIEPRSEKDSEEMMGLNDALEPLYFKHEMEALKREEEVQLSLNKQFKQLEQVGKRKQQMFDLLEKKALRYLQKADEAKAQGKPAPASIEAPEEEKEQLKKLQEEEIQDISDDQVERPQLATLENWIAYRFQVSECVFRAGIMKDYLVSAPADGIVDKLPVIASRNSKAFEKKQA